MFSEFEIFLLTVLDVIENRCVLFSNSFMPENLTKHESYESSGLFLWCFVYSGLLYLSFPIIAIFHHEEHSLTYLQEFSDPVNKAVNFLSRKTKKWKNFQMFFQAEFTETCQSNEFTGLAECKSRITSTVLLLPHV